MKLNDPTDRKTRTWCGRLNEPTTIEESVPREPLSTQRWPYVRYHHLRYLCMKRLAILLTFLLFLASCASTRTSARKCNGQHGTLVPMGVM